MTVTITGGTVTANGGSKGFGIGIGGTSTSSCSVIITGGSVYAYGFLGAMSVQPTNGTTPVYLREIDNPKNQTATIEGVSYPNTNPIYVYLPSGTHTVEFADGSFQSFPWEAPATPTTVPYMEGGEEKTISALPVQSDTTVWDGSNAATGGWYVVDKNVKMTGRVEVKGDVNLILADGAKLDAWYVGGIHVGSKNNASLTIWAQSDGTGELHACSNNLYQAGIGGNDREDAGTITINGGNITAEGRLHAAGIGGGAQGGAGTINIKGGTVTATSVASSTKTGAPGIGAGSSYTSVEGGSGTVNISGDAVVTATGAGETGAGIGVGENYRGGGVTVNISGGTVIARGGSRADGIGCSATAESSCTVNISGGSVTAIGGRKTEGSEGSEGGFGIGCGKQQGVGSVTITGGSVKADGGQGAMSVTPKKGSDNVYLLTIPNPDKKKITIDSTAWSPSVHSGESKLYAYVTGAHHDVTIEGLGSYAIEYDPGAGKFYQAGKTVTYWDGGEKQVSALPMGPSSTLLTNVSGQDAVWYVAEGDVTISQRITVTGNVNLILADGCKLTATNGISVNEGNSLTIWAQANGSGSLDATHTWTCAGIGGDAGRNAGTITIRGGKITAKGGAYAAGIGGGANGGAGDITINGGTVDASVYGDDTQRGGAGIGTGWDNTFQNRAVGSVTISGGVVTATGTGYGSAGIGTGDCFAGGVKVKIYGGTVTATGGSAAYGIGAARRSSNWGGSLTITGGSVKATGGSGAVSPQPTDGDEGGGLPVYLLQVSNPAGAEVKINDEKWSPSRHGSEDTLYAYVPGEETTVTVGENSTTYKFDKNTGTFVPDGAEYCQPEWTWNKTEDGMTAYAIFAKLDGTSGETLDGTVTVTDTQQATCEMPATVTYTATCTFNGETYTDTYDLVTGMPLGHDWDHASAELHTIYVLLDGTVVDAEPGEEIDLNDVDSMFLLVSITCKNGCGSVLNVDDIRVERAETGSKDSTCTEAGYTLWNEYYMLDGERHTIPGYETYQSPLPLADHTWTDWEEVKEQENNGIALASTVTTLYQRKCTVCGEVQTSTHKHTYKLPESNEPGQRAPDGVVWNVNSLGQVMSVTVTMQCTHTVEGEGESEGEGVPETETRTLSGSQIVIDDGASIEPTCTTAGRTVYSATLNVGSESRTYTYTVPEPALGHNWAVADEDAAWHFESDEYGHVTRCTVTLTCLNLNCYETMELSSDEESEDEDHFLEVFDTYADPTCTEGGYAYALAIAAYGEDMFGTTLINDPIPAMGHNLQATVTNIDYTNKTGTITVTCKRCDYEKVYVGHALTDVKAPTCTEAGSVSFDIEELNFGGDQSIPAMGHDFKDGVCTRCGEKDPDYAAPTATPTATAAAKAPNTGDETALLPWTVMLLVCAGALTVVLGRRRRER